MSSGTVPNVCKIHRTVYKDFPYTGRNSPPYRGLMKKVGDAIKAGHRIDFHYREHGEVDPRGFIDVTITREGPLT